MPTDRNYKKGRAQVTGEDVKDDLLRGVGLMALPVLAFQRNMLVIGQTGINSRDSQVLTGLLQHVQAKLNK